MTLSIPKACSSCPSSNPAGPAPMIATFVRNTCSIGYYRLWTAEARGRHPHILAMIIISYNSVRKGPSEALLSRGEDVDEEDVLGVAVGSQRDAHDGAGK